MPFMTNPLSSLSIRRSAAGLSCLTALLLGAPVAQAERSDRLQKINIAADRGVTVTLSVIDMVPTAAHIHEGAVGANGPVIVPLNKISEGAFVAPDNAKLTEAQYAAYKAGNLYVNVHSVKYPDGEVRAQIAGR